MGDITFIGGEYSETARNLDWKKTMSAEREEQTND